MQKHEVDISEVPGQSLMQTIFVPVGDKLDGTDGLSALTVIGTPVITFRDSVTGQEISIASAHDILFVRDACIETLRGLCTEQTEPTSLFLDAQLRPDAKAVSDGFGSS